MEKLEVALYSPLACDHARAVELGFSQFASVEEHEEHIQSIVRALDKKGLRTHVHRMPPDVLAKILEENNIESTSEGRAEAIAIAAMRREDMND